MAAIGPFASMASGFGTDWAPLASRCLEWLARK